MQSPGDNDMGKSREQRTREARAAKAEAARLAAEAEAARLAAEEAGCATAENGTSDPASSQSGGLTETLAHSGSSIVPEASAQSGTSPGPELLAQAGTSTVPESFIQPGTSAGPQAFTQSGTSTVSEGLSQSVTPNSYEQFTQSGASTNSTQSESGTQTPSIPAPPPPPPPPPGGGRLLSSLIASSPPDAGLTSPSSLVSSDRGAAPSPPSTSGASPSTVTPEAPVEHTRHPQDSQPAIIPDRPIRQRIIGASQPATSVQSPAQGTPPPRMIGLPNPDGAQFPPGSPTQAQQSEAPAPQPIPVKRDPRPEPGMTLDGKVCRHEYVRIYQRKLKGLDRRLVATRAYLPVGFKMGDFTYLSAGSFCFCSKCRKRLFPKRTEAEKQQARVERKLLKEMGTVDLMTVGAPREKTEFDDDSEDELDFLDDSDDESIFGKRTSSDSSAASEESDENLDDDKLKLDIHVDELEVESVDVEDIKAEGVKLTAEDDFDEACSLDVDEES